MDKKVIYLDHAATTATRPEVLEAMLPYFTENYGNPSSIYELGSKNKQIVTESREIIGKALGTDAQNIYFTAGGSEADNWALVATAEAFKNKEIILSHQRSNTMPFCIPVNIWKRNGDLK